MEPFGPETDDTTEDSESENPSSETSDETSDETSTLPDDTKDSDTVDSEVDTQETNPCADPEQACEDRPEPGCLGDDLITSEITGCDDDGEEIHCTYKEVTTPCDNGCEKGACKGSSACSFDENNDGINDVVAQPSSISPVCWRRCPLPAVWNGTSCEGEAQTYLWARGKKACEELGYQLPGAGYYTGPEVGGGILTGCQVVDLDWACDPCAESPDCSVMFGGDTGTYWTSTYRFYWMMDCYYKTDMSTGKLNFVDTSHRNRVRCILKK